MSLLSETIIKDKNLRDKLETAFLVSDYYHSIKKNKSLPKIPFPSLEEALKCTRLCKAYFEKVNNSIRIGIKLANCALTVEQVVYVWIYLKNQETQKQ